MDVHSPKNGINRLLIGIDPYPTKKLKVSLKREQDGNLETLWNSEEIVNCVFVFLRAFLNRFSLTYSSTSFGIEGELVVGVCRLCKRFYAKFLDIWFKAQLCQQCHSQKMSKRHPKLWRSYWIPRSLTTSATRRCNSKEPIAIFVLGQLSHIGLWNFGRPEGWWNGTDSEQTRRLHRLEMNRDEQSEFNAFNWLQVSCCTVQTPPLSGLMAGWGLCWWPSCRDGTAAW